MAMRIPEDWQNCVVPIETAQDSKFIGTGFLMSFYTMPCLITNRHVIEEENELQYRLNLPGQRIDRMKINMEEGFTDYFNWVYHPNEKIDLAAILVPFEASAKLIGMYFDQIGGADELYDGRDLFYWGFPLSLGAEDELQHYPIIRTGCVAQNRLKDKFVFEANIFPGSSGSPIFTKSVAIKEDTRIIFKAPRLVGIVESYISYQERAISEQTGRPRVIFQENSGLAHAIKAHCIFDILNSPEFKAQAQPIIDENKLFELEDARAHAYNFDPRSR